VRYFGGQGLRHAFDGHLLNAVPDAADASGAIGNLLDRPHTWQLVPGVNQSSNRPIRCQGQPIFSARKASGILSRLRLVHVWMQCDLVRVVFNRKEIHLDPFPASVARVLTFITPVPNTSKRIVANLQLRARTNRIERQGGIEVYR
jgi:hypothetical protein